LAKKWRSFREGHKDNLSGLVVDHLDYGAYGNVTNETQAANGDRFKYAGGVLEISVGIELFQARWYDPTIGRWISEDPLGLETDSNPDRYVGNEPTDATDPTGLVLKVNRAKYPSGANEVLAMLRKLYPEGDLFMTRDGLIKRGPNRKKSSHPEAEKCITDLITDRRQRHIWEIRPIVAVPKDYVDGNTNIVHPFTLPDGVQFSFPHPTLRNVVITLAGKPGYVKPDGRKNPPGTGGIIYVPTSKSELAFGDYDNNGRTEQPDLVIILAHELCGHAWYLNKGEEKRVQQPHGFRFGHDQAIKMENKIRKEQGLTRMRGLYSERRKHGESVWRIKTTDGEVVWYEKMDREIKKVLDFYLRMLSSLS
jgi:RHS repeat-associated protein